MKAARARQRNDYESSKIYPFIPPKINNISNGLSLRPEAGSEAAWVTPSTLARSYSRTKY